MKNFLRGSFLVLLPEHWRQGQPDADSIDWRAAAETSGLLQLILSLGLFIAWFLYSAGGHWADRAAMAAARAHPELSVSEGTIDSLVVVLILLHPLTWMLLYSAYEGAVRTLNARARMPIRATLPLRLVDRAMRYTKTRTWSETPKLIPDEVTRSDGRYHLKIASCRAKNHWKYPLTIRYQEEFFQVIGEEHEASFGARPYAYFLRHLPANETIKGLELYDPANVLLEKTPGFLEIVFSEIRRRAAK